MKKFPELFEALKDMPIAVQPPTVLEFKNAIQEAMADLCVLNSSTMSFAEAAVLVCYSGRVRAFITDAEIQSVTVVLEKLKTAWATRNANTDESHVLHSIFLKAKQEVPF